MSKVCKEGIKQSKLYMFYLCMSLGSFNCLFNLLTKSLSFSEPILEKIPEDFLSLQFWKAQGDSYSAIYCIPIGKYFVRNNILNFLLQPFSVLLILLISLHRVSRIFSFQPK